MNYLTRNKVYDKFEPNKDAKKIYIICEGQDNEYQYFRYFDGFSSNINIIPIPSINGQSDPLKLKEQAVALFFGKKEEELLPVYTLSKEDIDEVWFVIDTDRWNEGNKIEQLKEFCRQQNTVGLSSWKVAQSNPCFEIWHFYHFFEQMPKANSVAQYKSFKHFVNETIKGGFDNRTMPIKVDSAINNSALNYFADENGQPLLFSTQVHELARIIHSFIGVELEQAQQKALLTSSYSKSKRLR